MPPWSTPATTCRPRGKARRTSACTTCPTSRPFALLDASATCDLAAGTLTLAVVDRDPDQSQAATIDLGSAEARRGIEVSEVSGPDVAAMNSFERPDVVGVRDRPLELGGRSFEHKFPACSLSVLRMRLR
jgi:alpha-L-arabinofuranosidase